MTSGHATTPQSPGPWLRTTEWSRDGLDVPQRRRAGNQLLEGPACELWSQCRSCGDIVPFPGAQNSCCLDDPLRANESPARGGTSPPRGTGRQTGSSPMSPSELDSDQAADTKPRLAARAHEGRRRSGRDRRVPTSGDIAQELSPTLPFHPHGAARDERHEPSVHLEQQISPTLPFQPQESRAHARELSPSLSLHLDEAERRHTSGSSRSTTGRETSGLAGPRGALRAGGGTQRSPSHARRSRSKRRRVGSVAAQLGLDGGATPVEETAPR